MAARKKNPAVDFFYEWAGYARSPGESEHKARMRNAKALANAESIASERGWRCDWEEDPEGWDTLGDVPEEDVKEVLICVLRDEDGKYLESLGGNLMGYNSADNRRMGRLVEAELALQALAENK
jgi:hypothetical protein